LISHWAGAMFMLRHTFRRTPVFGEGFENI